MCTHLNKLIDVYSSYFAQILAFRNFVFGKGFGR